MMNVSTVDAISTGMEISNLRITNTNMGGVDLRIRSIPGERLLPGDRRGSRVGPSLDLSD